MSSHSHDSFDEVDPTANVAEDLDQWAAADADGVVPVRRISLALPPGSGEADYRAAYAAVAEQEAYWALFLNASPHHRGPPHPPNDHPRGSDDGGHARTR